MVSGQLPHPLTGQLFASPVPPGTGWPGDLATASTPVARTPAEVGARVESAAGLDALDALVSVCRACPRLVAWREQVARTGKRAAFAGEPYWGRPAPSFGDPDPAVVIVGLAPAAHGANRTGRVFTGDRSGDWLYAALHRVGLASQADSRGAGDGLVLRGVRITAAVHCAPPANKPTPAERHTCAPWLDRELQLVTDVRVLLALGSIGWEAALAAARRLGWGVPRPKPRFGHGAEAILERPSGHVVLLGCYHVSQQNTFTGKLTAAMLDDVLRRAASLG
ncbi:MAG: uracil-DNA glycosylase [Tetrasphaera sp.]